MYSYSRVSGLVLAGGRSSRMGQDKARLVVNGVPLFQLMISRLKSAGLRSAMLSGDGYASDGLIDLIPGKGPLSGIHAALNNANAEQSAGLCIVPVDMPLLSASLIRELCIRGLEQQQALCYEGFMLPIYLPVNAQTLHAVNQAINSPQHKDYSLYRLHRKLNGGTMPVPEGMERFFRNANTPNEWATCLSELTSNKTVES